MRKWKLAFVLFCIFLMSGCSTKREAEKESAFQSDKEYIYFTSLCESDEGVYHMRFNENPSLLKYIDKASAKRTVLCSKVNCKHDSKECPAFVAEEEFLGFIAYDDGKLYTLVHDSIKGNLVLYQMNKDGTDKKVLHEFKNMIVPNGAGIYKGKLIMSIMTQKEYEDGSGSFTAAPSVYVYDLKTEEMVTIIDGTKEEEQFTLPCGSSDDKFYLATIDFHKSLEDSNCVFRTYDFQKDELQPLWEGKGEDVQIIKDNMLYIQMKDEKKIMSHNLETGEEKTVLEWEDDFDSVYMQVGWIERYKEVEEDGQKRELYYWYDIESGEYLFEEPAYGDEIQVKSKLKNGYWIDKGEKSYFYDLKEKTWTEIE